MQPSKHATKQANNQTDNKTTAQGTRRFQMSAFTTAIPSHTRTTTHSQPRCFMPPPFPVIFQRGAYLCCCSCCLELLVEVDHLCFVALRLLLQCRHLVLCRKLVPLLPRLNFLHPDHALPKQPARGAESVYVCVCVSLSLSVHALTHPLLPLCTCVCCCTSWRSSTLARTASRMPTPHLRRLQLA